MHSDQAPDKGACKRQLQLTEHPHRCLPGEARTRNQKAQQQATCHLLAQKTLPVWSWHSSEAAESIFAISTLVLVPG